MAPAENDISIEEKRVYAGRAGRTDAYVATRMGVVRVAISGDRVGAFELVTHEPARDVGVLARSRDPDVLAVATAEGLRVATLGERDRELDPIVVDDTADDDATGDDTTDDDTTGDEATVAVGVHDGAFLAANADGTITLIGVTAADQEGGDGTVDVEQEESIETETVGIVDEPRAVDGPLIAAGDGVHRVVDSARGYRIESVGLDDVRDVAGAGVPLAATSDGLYWLGNGWMNALDRSFDAVDADGNGHAMAAADGILFVRAGSDGSGTGWGADAWTESTLPVDGRPGALGYGPGLSVVVTDDGSVCVDAGDGWRHQPIGVRGVEGLALGTVDGSED